MQETHHFLGRNILWLHYAIYITKVATKVYQKLKENKKTSWVCSATLEFDYRLGWDGLGLGWGKNLGPAKR